VTPSRIVSLVPSSTESVAALGAGARLVGCTRYCTHPAAELALVARVGGTKNPDREQVLQLRPDLVLGNAEENRPEDLEWLAERVPVLVQTPRTVVEAARDLRALAQRLDALPHVEPVLLRIEAWLTAAAAATIGRARARVFYAVWPKPWMSANRDTFVHDVVRLGGCENVMAAAAERYPQVSPATVDADLVLLPSEPWAFDERQRDELAAARTFGAARLALCDGRDFCWHGIHMAEGLGHAFRVLGLEF
jgi:ABC-type Fe3+-hydroxamate transport system substrate-binding protein